MYKYIDIDVSKQTFDVFGLSKEGVNLSLSRSFIQRMTCRADELQLHKSLNVQLGKLFPFIKTRNVLLLDSSLCSE
jgi:hypothetical protein